MTATDATPRQGAPARFAADLDWGAGAGAPLRLLLRLFADVPPEPTEEELRRHAAALRRGDPPADRLVAAIAAREISGRRVREEIARVGEALAAGRDPGLPARATDDTPAPLLDFLRAISDTPAWYDPELADRGARACLRAGVTGMDVLNNFSLLSGYRPAATTEVLVGTGRLTGDRVRRRVGETVTWWYRCVSPGGARPGGPGWALTVHVRLIHARVNRSFLDGGWDVDAKGLPVNQADQAGTNGLFSSVFLAGTRGLGVPYGHEDSRAVMHLWRYLGWLMGVEEEWLHERESDGLRDQYHFVLTAPPPDPNSQLLGRDLMASFRLGDYRRFSRPLRRFEYEKQLSVATLANGPAGMREVGLTPRPPWYPLLVAPVNVLAHLASRLVPGGTRRLERRADRRIRARIATYSGEGLVEP